MWLIDHIPLLVGEKWSFDTRIHWKLKLYNAYDKKIIRISDDILESLCSAVEVI